MKDELDQKVNYGVGSGHHWSPKLTNPKEPKFV